MTTTLPSRFADLINGLWRVVAGHQGGGVQPQRMDPAVIALVYHHLRSIAKRFAALCARAEAGTLRAPRIRKPVARTPVINTPADPTATPKARAPAKRFPERLPGIHAWLRTLSNPVHHTNIAANHFRIFFEDPELRTLAARAPQLQRILRPLCTMLGIERPQPDPAPTEPAPTEPSPTEPSPPRIEAVESATVRLVSAVTRVELSYAVEGREREAGRALIEQFFAETCAEIMPVTPEQAILAIGAFREYGKGRHPAGLNIGDCFPYALARATGQPLLFKGGDLALTDIDPA